MKVRLKRLHPDAQLPCYAKPGDAGMDLTAVSMETTVDYVEYKTGIAVEIPEGYAFLKYQKVKLVQTILKI